jgi:uncharacterized protein (TIGR00369 family)
LMGATSKVDALIAADPYLTALGLRSDLEDHAVVVLPPLDRHVAVPGPDVLHGGVVAALLEATASLRLCVATGARVHTIEFTSDFLRPVPLAPTYATATVVRLGRRLANVRVDAWQRDRDHLLAVGHGRFLVGLRP